MYSNVYHIQNIELGSAQRVCVVHWGHIENPGVVLSSWSSVCEVNDGSKSYCLLEMLIFFPGDQVQSFAYSRSILYHGITPHF